MTQPLSPAAFTAEVVQKLGRHKIAVSSSEPLIVGVSYGDGEPALTLNLESLFADYEAQPAKFEELLQPLVTEVGWTAKGTRYSVNDIAQHALPMMRDLLRDPLTAEESTSDKGPLLFQKLVERPEEHVIVQYLLAKNEMLRPLYTGDMLRSYPEPAEFNAICVQNLRNIVLQLGLTLSEYYVENLTASLYLVGLRGGSHRQFMSSLIVVPEVMKTLQQTLKAEDGLVAILPSRDQLLVGTNQDEVAIVEVGLLARYLKDNSTEPVSSFVWFFKEGSLSRVRTIDLQEPSQGSDSETN